MFKIKKEIFSEKWHKVGSWKIAPLMWHLIVEATNKRFLRSLDFSVYFRKILYLDGTVYFLEKDYQKYLDYYEKQFRKSNLSFFNNYMKLIYRSGQKSIWFAKKLQNQKINQYKSTQLKYIFKKLINYQQRNVALGYNIQPLDEFLTKMVINKLLIYTNGNIDQAQKIFYQLAVPPANSYVIQEIEQLNKIILQIRNNPKIKSYFKSHTVKQIQDGLKKLSPAIDIRIIKHWQYFCWMNSPDWILEPYNITFYIKRIKDALFGQYSQKKSESTHKSPIYSLKNIKAMGIEGEIKLVTKMINAKMFNWDAVSISGHYARGFMAKIGELAGLTYSQSLFLCPQELLQIIDNKRILVSTINRRIKRFSSIRTNSKITELSQRQVSTIKKFFDQGLNGVNILNGQSVYGGVVRGRICIIFSADNIRKIKKGQILVCPMTNPNYVPAVYKSRAIITDEGGVLCHAAIIARELKKPCIVGTRIATKIFKDGNLVEVDAQKGTIRILKR